MVLRLLRALSALTALLLGLVGIPLALVLLGGNPLPRQLSREAVVRVLLRPDDGTVLLGLITFIGWVAWLLFAVAVLTELVNALSGYRLRLRIPGLGGPQRLVAGLMLTVSAVLTVPLQSAHATPPPLSPHAAPPSTSRVTTPPAESTKTESASTAGPRTASPATSSVGATPDRVATVRPAPAAETDRSGVTHVVERGDDLWSLAEHYYGHGSDWRRIAHANPRLLTGGPDRLQIGWRLTIPDPQTAGASHHDTVVVRRGDSLSSIAEDAYGAPSKWRNIFEANREALDDPDEVEVGTRLTIPAAAGSPPPAHQAREHEHRAPDQSDEASNGLPKATDGVPKVRPNPPSSRPELHQRQDAPPPHQPSSPASPQVRPSGAQPSAGHPTRIRPTVAQPTRAHSLPAASPGSGGASQEAEGESPVATADAALGLLSVGGLLAAAVVGGLHLRRRVQLQSRPLGRRLPQPARAAVAVETALGHRQTPLGLDTLDLAMRAVAAHCRDTSRALPPLVLAKVGSEAIELVMSEPVPEPPVGFELSGRSWLLDQQDASYLSSSPTVRGAVRAYPTLVSLGRDDAGQQVLMDLESCGLLALDGERPALAEAVLAAMAVELSFLPWADEMTLTLVGSFPEPEVMSLPNVTRTAQLDQVLDRLERRAAAQRAHSTETEPRRSRLDPDLADSWAPEIVLVQGHLTPEQATRLAAVATTLPRVPLAAVVGEPVPEASWTLSLDEDPAGGGSSGDPTGVTARLQPLDLSLRPQLLPPPARRAVVELLAVTGSDETTPAPWWDHGGDPPDARQPDNVTYLGTKVKGWGSDNSELGKGSEVVMQEQQETGGAHRRHPVLKLLGPVELVGATGSLPPRAGKQCLEYCGWLLEHPGTTAQAMAAALVVAEGTRRSNMSRLRTWLGADPDGDPYLPDAYTGRILLHESVSSDWQRLQILTAPGVNRTSTAGLRAALELVRGAPLADAAPGQWHWAEEMRTDMISVIRDMGVELASRALLEHDIDLARWAAARALAAAPGDELLLALRIRTEHQAGNGAETERLTLQLAAQARSLGVDLDFETVVLMQEVMEGRVRSRLA